MDNFDYLNPIDYRYYGRDKKAVKEIGEFLSEEARIKYQAKVEAALAKALAKNKICSAKIANEIVKACEKVKAEDVYAEEDRIKHDVRALANVIRNKVSKEAKPFVHFTATSQDIIDTANSLRYKDFAEKVLLPDLVSLEKTLIKLALREKKTLQIGRTHGQHAEPITFGFAIASYVDRLGNCITNVKWKKEYLQGKFSGAVGAYNASSLVFSNPEKFENDVLKYLGLEPCYISTQIIQPEPLLNYLNAVNACFGVLANLADDMRNLQRSEINEIAEVFESKQVGSSTMPHKRNPINFENVKSFWKEYMPRVVTFYMDQISEHQRDLTNSASQRFIPEYLAGFDLTVRRLDKVMSRIVVDKESMLWNFEKNESSISAEPLYILLAVHGHPDAHEKVRELTLESAKKKINLFSLADNDKSLKPYLCKFTPKQMSLIKDPKKYTGHAEKKTEKICKYWQDKLKSVK
ncbi:MAG: lyase family protein [Candidatus Diapherotrites archaeon]